MLINYLLVGLFVQLTICAERVMRGIVTLKGLRFLTWIFIIVAFVIGVLIWPIQIIGEIYNIKNERDWGL